MSEQRQQTKQLLDAVLDFISIFEDEDEDATNAAPDI